MESSSFKTKPEPQNSADDHDTDLWTPERLFTKQMGDVATTLPISNTQSVTPHHLITIWWRSLSTKTNRLPAHRHRNLQWPIKAAPVHWYFLHVDKVASVGGDSATGRPTICHISLLQAATESGWRHHTWKKKKKLIFSRSILVFTSDLLLFSLITTSSDKLHWRQNVTKKQKGREEKDQMSEISD